MPNERPRRQLKLRQLRMLVKNRLKQRSFQQPFAVHDKPAGFPAPRTQDDIRYLTKVIFINGSGGSWI